MGGMGGGGGGGGFPGMGGFGGQPGGQTFSFTSGGGAPGGMGGFQASDPNDIFSRLFGGSDPFAAMGGGGGGMGGGGMDPFGGGASRTRRGPPRQSTMPGMGGMPGGFDGMGGAAGPSSPGAGPNPEQEKPIPVALEDLYKGAKKKFKISRRVASGAMEEKVIEVDIKAGWKAGTKIRYNEAGNHLPDGRVQDMVFIIQEKPHATFKREGDDLRFTKEISLLEALDPPKAGTPAAKKSLTTLDGRVLSIPLPPAGVGRTTIENGKITRVSGEGMPISKSNGTRKGDLIVEWKVTIPARLTEEQRTKVKAALGGL